MYFTTDGTGGICSFFVGTGMAMHVTPDVQKMWQGDVQSGLITTGAQVSRFSDVPLRFRRFEVRNDDASYYAQVGQYYATWATFDAKAWVLAPREVIKFEYANLFEYGCIGYTAAVNVRWIGTNKY